MNDITFEDSGMEEFQDMLGSYLSKVDEKSALDAIEEGAKEFVNDLLRLPKPRRNVTAPGYTHLVDSFSYKTDISKIGDGTCTGAISALNQSLGNLKTDLNKLNSLGNISIMKMGTKILEILPGNNSCLLLSKNDVISALGLSSSTFNFDNLCVSITNGDGAAFSGHLESPTITTTGIYVVWKDKVTASCNIRVNYILFYHD